MLRLLAIAVLGVITGCSSDDSNATTSSGSSSGGASAAGTATATGSGAATGAGGSGGATGTGGAATSTGLMSAGPGGAGGGPIDCKENPTACPDGWQCFCGGPASALCECAAPCKADADCTSSAQPLCCGKEQGMGVCTSMCACLCD